MALQGGSEHPCEDGLVRLRALCERVLDGSASSGYRCLGMSASTMWAVLQASAAEEENVDEIPQRCRECGRFEGVSPAFR